MPAVGAELLGLSLTGETPPAHATSLSIPQPFTLYLASYNRAEYSSCALHALDRAPQCC